MLSDIRNFMIELTSVGSVDPANDLLFPVSRYSSSSNANDIALLKMAEPINFNNAFVGPACLPKQWQNNEGKGMVTFFTYTHTHFSGLHFCFYVRL